MQATHALRAGLATTFAIALFTATPASSSSAGPRTLHAAYGTLRFFENHPQIVRAHRTRPIALREIARARAFIAAHQPPPVPDMWQRDAVCETGYADGGWHTRAGIYEGGIRFYYGTGDAWKGNVAGASAYDHADEAPAYLQAAVAQWGLDHYGTWGCVRYPHVRYG